jgi:hypothetical protein
MGPGLTDRQFVVLKAKPMKRGFHNGIQEGGGCFSRRYEKGFKKMLC